MWLFREHRGGLEEAMETCKSYDSLLDIVSDVSECALYSKGDLSTIKISFYSNGDNRIGWYPVYVIYQEYKNYFYIIGFCTEKK